MLNEPGRALVVVGGSSAIAGACVEQWIGRGVRRVHLIGRRAASLVRARDDFATRFPALDVTASVGDMDAPESVDQLVSRACASLSPDVVLIAHGDLPDQSECETDLVTLQRTLSINAVSPALFASAFCGKLLEQGRGTLVVIGSVAGDRGRQSNYAYGSAKGLLERFVEGLQHRCNGSRVRVVLAKPGPTASRMTSHLVAQGRRVARVDLVASRIVAGAEAGHRVVYAPGVWRWIMAVIRWIPSPLFERTKL